MAGLFMQNVTSSLVNLLFLQQIYKRFREKYVLDGNSILEERCHLLRCESTSLAAELAYVEALFRVLTGV